MREEAVADQEELEPEESDALGSGSFFGDGERADELACKAIWNMFAKASNARGIDCRSPQSVGASAARQRNEKEEEETMKDEVPKKRGAMLELALAGYKELEHRHGRAPTVRELFDHMGEETAVSVQNVRMTLKRLVKKGQISMVTTTRAKKVTGEMCDASKRAAIGRRLARGYKAPAPSSKPRKEPVALVTSADPILAALIAKRDELAGKVAALTTAIEALRS